jgi:hypothetical protein
MSFDKNGVWRPESYREFYINTARATMLEYAGVGLTPEDVFRQREKRFLEDFKASGKGPHGFLEEWDGDEAVWEGTSLVGLIRSHVDGQTVWQVVYRFDNRFGDDAGRVYYPSEHSAAIGRKREIMHAGCAALDPDEDEDDDEDED